MASTVKRLGKQAIGYPEDATPVISSSDYLRSLKTDPKHQVCSIKSILSATVDRIVLCRSKHTS